MEGSILNEIKNKFHVNNNQELLNHVANNISDKNFFSILTDSEVEELFRFVLQEMNITLCLE
jgi:DNA-binding protein Fis